MIGSKTNHIQPFCGSITGYDIVEIMRYGGFPEMGGTSKSSF